MSEQEVDTSKPNAAKKNAVRVLVISILIAIPVTAYFLMFGVKDDAGVSNHGMIALTLAIVLGFLSAFLFMGITFFSARSGIDDQPNYREIVEKQRQND